MVKDSSSTHPWQRSGKPATCKSSHEEFPGEVPGNFFARRLLLVFIFYRGSKKIPGVSRHNLHRPGISATVVTVVRKQIAEGYKRGCQK